MSRKRCTLGLVCLALLCLLLPLHQLALLHAAHRSIERWLAVLDGLPHPRSSQPDRTQP